MLDRFIWGKVTRISPEAPVPVVNIEKEAEYPGGAANAARNLVPFAGAVLMMGRVGADQDGYTLKDILKEGGIDSTGVQRTDCETITKTRIIASKQQVVRFDREKTVPISGEVVDLAKQFLLQRAHQLDGLIISDYGKGFVTTELVSQIAREARAAGKIVAADPNPRHSVDWRGVTVVKPNRAEAFLAAGVPWRDTDETPTKDRHLERTGKALLKKWETNYVLITLGEHGMMLFQQNDAPHYIPTRARQVFDVSGAGDTAIALFTLGLVCGATPIEAAEIANHGSAVVVSKLGTATVTRDELIASFREDTARE